MAERGSPEYGTLVIAALLILALIFAGAWIDAYVSPDSDPQHLWPWFGAAAGAVVVGGMLYFLFGRRR
jgi:uncharacterized membrane protein YedE/YeeE